MLSKGAASLQLAAWATLGCALALAGLVPQASAHTIRPQDVVARLEAPGLRDAFAIVDVAPSDSLPRLLVIKVDERWHAIDAERRRSAAEGWRQLWRSSIADGIVAIVDARTEASLVAFDVNGRARLKTPATEK